MSSGTNGKLFHFCFGIWYTVVNLMFRRVNVEPYVKNVSGARHKSFRTHDQALSYYLDAKAEHRVCVVRNPDDDAIYGPRSEAMQ